MWRERRADVRNSCERKIVVVETRQASPDATVGGLGLEPITILEVEPSRATLSVFALLLKDQLRARGALLSKITIVLCLFSWPLWVARCYLSSLSLRARMGIMQIYEQASMRKETHCCIFVATRPPSSFAWDITCAQGVAVFEFGRSLSLFLGPTSAATFAVDRCALLPLFHLSSKLLTGINYSVITNNQAHKPLIYCEHII